MTRTRFAFFLFIGLSIVLGRSTSTSMPSARLAPSGAGAETPLYFVANRGQTSPEVLFYARKPGLTAWLTGTGMVIERSNPAAGTGSKRDVYELKFIGAQSAIRAAALDETGYRVSYFYGAEESEWRTDIPTSRAVHYRDVYDGIDLKVYGNDGRVEFDWVVRPGADPSRIGFAVEGDEGTILDRDGNIVVGAPEKGLKILKPMSFQDMDGGREDVASSFRAGNDGRFEFVIGPYDRTRPLVIDPLVLAYSSYLGGRGADEALSIAVDATGAAYVAGYTRSLNFPPVTVSKPREDVFISKISPDGKSLIYSAFFPSYTDLSPSPGRARDRNGVAFLPELAVDGKGAVYLTGMAMSRGFPVKNAFQTELKGGSDAFILKLAPSGKSLVFSSFLGGSSYEAGLAVASDVAGSVYVGGMTVSRDFPVKKAFQSKMPGAYDIFVSKFSPDGRDIVFSTYLGSSHYDVVGGLAVDGEGAVYVAGIAGLGFPLKNPFQAAYGGGIGDVFVSKLAASGDKLVYSSYLGGPGEDRAEALAVDAAGAVYVTGFTSSKFPTLNAFQKSRKGSGEGFVTKVAPDGSGMVYSTYLGGMSMDWPFGLAIDGEGAAYVYGTTWGSGFPLKDPYQSAIRGRKDAFLTILAPSGKSLISSTYLGGRYEEYRGGIALDGEGGIYVAGMTNSPDFPVSKAFQKSLAGDFDAFVLKLKLSD